MIYHSGKFLARPFLARLLLAVHSASAQAPAINSSLDVAIRQIERQPDDFETGMA